MTIDELIQSFSSALSAADWQAIAELDKLTRPAVEEARRTLAPAEFQKKIAALAELNQQAQTLAEEGRKDIAAKLKQLATAKSGLEAYSANSAL